MIDYRDAYGIDPRHGSETGASVVRRSTAATGYLGLGLLGLTLLIGPANLLLRRRNPVSSLAAPAAVVLPVAHQK